MALVICSRGPHLVHMITRTSCVNIFVPSLWMPRLTRNHLSSVADGVLETSMSLNPTWESTTSSISTVITSTHVPSTNPPSVWSTVVVVPSSVENFASWQLHPSSSSQLLGNSISGSESTFQFTTTTMLCPSTVFTSRRPTTITASCSSSWTVLSLSSSFVPLLTQPS